MLNYLSAELWRMTRRRLWLFGWLVYFGLVALAAGLWSWEGFSQSVTAFQDFMALGVFLCFPLAAAANGEALRSGTLRNEVSCGLPRRRVYLGKLLAALLAGLLLLLATAAVYLAVALALSGGEPDREETLFWMGALGVMLLTALPRYIGALALAHLLCFTLRTGGLAAVCYYLYLTMGEATLANITLYGLGPVGEAVNALARVVRPYLITGGFSTFIGAALVTGPAAGWLTGMGWTGLTTAAGLALSRRREIR